MVEPRISMPRALLLVCAVVAFGTIPLVRGEPRVAAVVVEAEDKASPAPSPARLPADQRIAASLLKPTQVSFEGTSLEDAVSYLADFHVITIRLDTDALKAAHIDLQKNVLTLQLDGVTFKSTLRLILEPLDLGYYIEGGKLVVSTRDKAAAHLFVDAYNISDIVAAGIESTDVIRIMMQFVDPTTWQSTGGPGSVRAERRTLPVAAIETNKAGSTSKRSMAVEESTLVVRHTNGVHQRIRSFMGELRLAQRGLRRPLDVELRQSRSYAIGDLRNKGVPDEILAPVLGYSFLVAAGMGEQVVELAEIKGDELVVSNEPSWSHVAAVAFLSALRDCRRSAPDGPLTDEQVEFAKSGIDVEARRRWIRRKLNRPVEVNFVGTSLSEAMQLLTRINGINMVLDTVSTDSGEVKPAASPTTIVTLQKRKEPIIDFIDELLLPLSLDWFVNDEVIAVTTAEVAAKRMETRVYRLKELLAAGHTEHDLAQRAVKKTTVRQSDTRNWDADNPLAGRMHVHAGYLFVTHNPRVQRTIEQMLEVLQEDARK
jgi:hypothetical protein